MIRDVPAVVVECDYGATGLRCPAHLLLRPADLGPRGLEQAQAHAAARGWSTTGGEWCPTHRKDAGQ